MRISSINQYTNYNGNSQKKISFKGSLSNEEVVEHSFDSLPYRRSDFAESYNILGRKFNAGTRMVYGYSGGYPVGCKPIYEAIMDYNVNVNPNKHFKMLIEPNRMTYEFGIPNKFYIADPNEKIEKDLSEEAICIVYDEEPAFITIDNLRKKYLDTCENHSNPFEELYEYAHYQERAIDADWKRFNEIKKEAKYNDDNTPKPLDIQPFERLNEKDYSYPYSDYKTYSSRIEAQRYLRRIKQSEMKRDYAYELINILSKSGNDFLARDGILQHIDKLKEELKQTEPLITRFNENISVFEERKADKEKELQEILKENSLQDMNNALDALDEDGFKSATNSLFECKKKIEYLEKYIKAQDEKIKDCRRWIAEQQDRAQNYPEYIEQEYAKLDEVHNRLVEKFREIEQYYKENNLKLLY